MDKKCRYFGRCADGKYASPGPFHKRWCPHRAKEHNSFCGVHKFAGRRWSDDELFILRLVFFRLYRGSAISKLEHFLFTTWLLDVRCEIQAYWKSFYRRHKIDWEQTSYGRKFSSRDHHLDSGLIFLVGESWTEKLRLALNNVTERRERWEKYQLKRTRELRRLTAKIQSCLRQPTPEALSLLREEFRRAMMSSGSWRQLSPTFWRAKSTHKRRRRSVMPLASY